VPIQPNRKNYSRELNPATNRVTREISGLDIAARSLRYSTPGEAADAYEKGLMSDHDAALHVLYFEERRRQQQAKAKAPRK